MISTRTALKLAVLVVISLIAASFMLFQYVRVPETMMGIGQYTVRVDLPEAAGLYENANVTYSGVEIGRVKRVGLTPTGVEAVLSLRSDIPIPSKLQAQVHSVSAVGEQYVALVPVDTASTPLRDGDVIERDQTSVPPDINALLDATNRGLQAIPQEDLKTATNEAFVAFAGLGPELSRIVNGSNALAADAHRNLDSITTLVDQSAPILNTQAESADAITALARNLATITGQLREQDAAVANVLDTGGVAADEVRQLLQRVAPTLPLLLANLASIGQVAVTYQPAIEQLLVLVPQATAITQATLIPNLNTTQDYRGAYLDFQLNLNLPPPCNTGFLPAQQRRPPAAEDYPERPAGDLYCRIPQDSPFNVRGARNIPCMTVPGKRAPTVKMCESDEQYVPLNDGYNWKGDPNATASGQGIPQLPPAPQAAQPPPVAVVPYDPANGNYIGPDGRMYAQTDVSNDERAQTWQDMVMPPTVP